MALVPSISLSLGNKCNKITLKETTNPYNATDNTGGWGSPNIVTTDVTSAYVDVLPFTDDYITTATCTGSISGTTFTDTTHTSGVFSVGQYLSGPGIALGTQIVALGTGTGTNNGGTYIINISQTLGPITITGSNSLVNYVIKDATTNLYTLLTNNPIPLEGTVISEATWSAADGIYHPVYTVVDSSGTSYVSQRTYVLFICNLCACKDKLVLKLIDACTGPEVKKLKEQVDQMEVFIYGIKSAFACGDLDTADAILTAASTYCTTITNCGCGCGDCK